MAWCSIQKVRPESGDRVAQEREILNFRAGRMKVCIWLDVVSRNATKIAIQTADAPQVGGIDDRPLVAAIVVSLGKWQANVAMARAKRTTQNRVERCAGRFF